MTFAISTDGSWRRHLEHAPDHDRPRPPKGLSRRTAALAGLLEDDEPQAAPRRAGALVEVLAAERMDDIVGVEALGAQLDWRDARALIRIGAMATPLETLILNRPSLADAYNAFERARIALERGEPKRAHIQASMAIEGRRGRRGDRYEHRFRMLRGLVRLGVGRPTASLDAAPDEAMDLDGACEDLAIAARGAWDAFDALCVDEAPPREVDAAEIDYLLAELSAAWAFYCNGDLTGCRRHAGRAVAQHAGLARGHFLLAKALAAQGDDAAALGAAERTIAADENFAPLIAADGDFRRLDKPLGDLLEHIRQDADALLARFETARKHAVKAVKGGPAPAPVSLSAPRPPLSADASTPKRLAYVKRFASELWSFMADVETVLSCETPRRAAAMQAGARRRGRDRRRLLRRAVLASAACVLVGAARGRGLAMAVAWMQPDIPDLALFAAKFALFAGVALLAHRIWRRLCIESRLLSRQTPLSPRQQWALRAHIELNRAFDALNGAFKAPRYARYFPDTTSMFRAHLGGPTRLDRLEGRLAPPPKPDVDNPIATISPILARAGRLGAVRLRSGA